MKNFILFILIFASQSYFYAQKFPVSFEIRRSYQECSQCQVETRSNWSLVNPNSYSDKIRDAIENKIFVEKSYAETLGYYLDVNEKDYDKECEVSRSGKHVWKDKVSSLKDNMSKDYFTEYHKSEAVRKEKLSKEEETKRISKENEKKKLVEYKVEYEKLFAIQQEDRQKVRLLIENKETEKYLSLQEKICKTWGKLDSIYYSNRQMWKDLDIKTTMQVNYSDYYLDINNFALQALFSKRFDKVQKATYMLIKDGDSFRRLQGGTELEMSIARYCSHGSFLINDKRWFWFTQRAVKQSYDQQKKEKWCKLMIDDYNKFEELGIIQNTDSLKFIVKAWTNQLSVLVSQSASSKTKNAFEAYQGLPRYISKFISSVDENFICTKENQKDNSKIKLVDKNLYLISYPINYSLSYQFYFYLNKKGDLFIVNYSTDKDPSDKKWAILIAKSKEIRDIDLGIISPK